MSYGQYGGPPTHGHGGYGAPTGAPPGYGAPPSGAPAGGYGAPPGAPAGGYGAPPGAPAGGYGASPGAPAGGYGAPPGAPGGYNAPPGGHSGGYNATPGPPGGYGGPPGYGGSTTGGFAPSPAQRGPPPGADPQLWSWFTAVDTDRSGAITPTELERALINGDWTPFDLDTVKLLMTIFDTDRSGTIGFNEFSGLWKYIKDWQGVFKHFDRDRSGSIDKQELHEALQQFGFNLSPQLLALVEKKYDVKASVAVSNMAPAGISFDRFVRACVVVKQLSEAFRKLDTDQDGWVQINYDQFMQTVLSLP